MGKIRRFFGLEKATTTSERPASWFVDWIRDGKPTLSGTSVTPVSAMRLAAVWACVRVRSDDVGKTPCHLYKRLPDGGKIRATNDTRHALIHSAPNPRMTAMEFKQLLQAHVDIHGDGYALKEFDARGNVTALWPVSDPCKVSVLVAQDGKDLFYKIGNDDAIPAEGVLHLRGFSTNGMTGLSPIGQHRETIGLAMAAEQYGAAFFGNSAQPRGGIKVPGVLSEPAAKALRNSWENNHRGVEESNKVAIFDGGMEWVQTGMNNTDAQYMELRAMQNQEIWRIYRVPAHKVGDLSRSTNNNIEQQALEYVTDCLMSEFVRWEQTLSRDLLSAKERESMFYEFLPDALLRGDITARYSAYAIGRNWGFLSVNDIRERENMNKVANGDIYLEPLNMVEAGKRPDPVAQVVAPPPETKEATASIIRLEMARTETRLERMAEAVDRLTNAPQPEPQPINVKVEAPIVNVAPAAITVTPPDVTVNVDAKKGRSITNVLEHDEKGRVVRFENVPEEEVNDGVD